MTAAEVAAHLDGYRRHAGTPVVEHTTVSRVREGVDGYVVETDGGHWSTRAVIVATGAAGTPHVPALAAAAPPRVLQVTPTRYRNPDQVPDGGVLVVGASASGLQLADELQRSGRPVTLAVGDHVRLPRTYRGMDIHWWLDAVGALDERIDEVPDPARARRLPSLQLIGSPERRNLDLRTLRAGGVEVVGRLVGLDDQRAQFAGSLANLVASADLKLGRLLDRIDSYASAQGLDGEVDEPDRPPPSGITQAPNVADLRGIGTIVWATGFRPAWPWLHPSLLDRRGAVRHEGGVLPAAGMYVLGLPFLRRRKSSFLDGVGADAEEIAAHLDAFLAGRGTSDRLHSTRP
jgi:putative flavoprotein involved in K+ transport